MVVRAVDVLVASVLVALGFTQLVSDPPDRTTAAALLALAMTMPVLVRRQYPLTVLTLVCAAAGAYTLAVAPTPPFAGFLALLVLCFTVTYELPLRRAARALPVAIAVVVVTGISEPATAFDWVYPVVYFGGAAVLGRLLRVRARRQADENEEQIRAAIAAERGHIARELHDVVAHGLGVMVLHAEAADELMRTDPETAHSSLRQVQQTGREAVRELKLLLGLLRTSEDAQIESRAPQPLIAELPGLVAQATGARCRLEGPLDELPPGLQLAVYRVVQEALTNTVRHSRATSVDVCVRHDGSRVVAEVVDEGPRRTDRAGTGHGLVGMTERARLYGGTVDAGPSGDGFRVRLEVPVP